MILLGRSPHEPPFAVLIIELVQQEHCDYCSIRADLDEQRPDHLLLGRVAVLLLVHALHVQVEVLVLQLEAQHQEGNRKVTELHQLAQAEVTETSTQPEDEPHQFKLAIDHLFEDEVEGEGIGEAEGELGNGWLEHIAVDVESIVPVVC